MFTYNNCNLPYAVRNVENNWASYVPKTKLLSIIKQTGFEVIESFDAYENVSWLEIKKPGTLTSLRGGQTLGEILTI